MDLFSLAARLSLDSSEYEQGLDNAENSAKTKGGAIGKALGTIGKITAAGTVAAGAAVIKLASDATNSYKDYEQLVGGVETLFGTGGKNLEEYAANVGKSVEEAEGDFNNFQYAQAEVLKNADKAFDTAGMSANEYMETVTGFSAALIQSMGGDTLEAAKKADMAITDMSDNANKMGTAMESIQVAYAGFSKQNYTMLDNLKLGYGGTKEEMERLLTDAEAIKAAHGEMADYSIDSYADVIDAIHTVQEEMGITGTTAKEGSVTIEGSANRMKAAWGNLVTSFAKGDETIKENTTTFLKALSTWGNNILPVFMRALEGIGEFVKVAIPKILSMIPPFIKKATPKVISAAMSLVGSVLNAIPGALKGLGKTLRNLIPIVRNAVKEIGDGLPLDLKQYVLPAFGSITAFLTDVFRGDWAKAWEEIKNIYHNAFDGVSRFFEDKFGSVKDTILSIDWVDVGEKILSAITGVLSSITSVVFDIFANVVNTITTIDWGDVGGKIFTLLSYGLGQIVEFVKNVFTQAKNFIAEIDWSEIGYQIADFFISSFEAIVEGIKTIDWVGLGASILDFLTTAFSSASELFGTIAMDVWNYVSQIDWVGLGTTIWTFITNAFAGIGDWAVAKFTELGEWIKKIDWLEVGNKIWDTIISAFSLVGEWALEKFGYLGEVIKTVDWLEVGNKIWDTIISAFNEIATWAKEKFEFLGDRIKNGVDWEKVGSDVWGAIKKGFSMIVDWGLTVGKRIKTGLSSIDWPGLGDTIWKKIKEFAGILTNTDNPIITFGSSVGDKIREGIANIKWLDLGKNLWGKIKEGVLAINADGLATINFGEWLGAKIREKLFGDSNLNIWSYAGQQIWAKIKEGWGYISKGVGSVITWATDLGGDIKSAIGNINWLQLGTDVWNAIKSGFTSVGEFFTGLFDFSKIKIKFPKITVTEWADFGPFRVPWNFDVVWEKKGYENPLLFKSPGLLGGYGFGDLGAYQGGEMVYSHDKLMDDIRAASGGGNNITINVYQQPGEDSEALAERISQIMNDNYNEEGQVVYA